MDKPSSIHDLSNFNGIKMVHLNVRSLLKKIDQIRLLNEGSGIDVLTISETWLKPHLKTSLVDLKGYQAFRLDRDSNSKNKKKGWGTHFICQ